MLWLCDRLAEMFKRDIVAATAAPNVPAMEAKYLRTAVEMRPQAVAWAVQRVGRIQDTTAKRGFVAYTLGRLPASCGGLVADGGKVAYRLTVDDRGTLKDLFQCVLWDKLNMKTEFRALYCVWMTSGKHVLTPPETLRLVIDLALERVVHLVTRSHTDASGRVRAEALCENAKVVIQQTQFLAPSHRELLLKRCADAGKDMALMDFFFEDDAASAPGYETFLRSMIGPLLF